MATGSGMWMAAYNGLSRFMSSACVVSGSHSGPYHKYCGCALHGMASGFDGSGTCSPVSQVKLSKKSSGMRRSISVSNLDGKVQCRACGSADAMPSPFDSICSPDCSNESIRAVITTFGSDVPRADLKGQTLELIEELACLIRHFKENGTEHFYANKSLGSKDEDDVELEASTSLSSTDSAESLSTSFMQVDLQVPGVAAIDFPCMLSPMEGNFYRSPTPEDSPYVKIGDRVREGQVLCVIDTLKLITEIEADEDGTLIDVLTMDGMPVRVGTPIFVIRPHHLRSTERYTEESFFHRNNDRITLRIRNI